MVKTRREFGVWHQRMKQALFALASPDEIKTLVRIEAQVKTPVAVAAYLNYAITIAIALSIPEVTDPLDIGGLRAEMEKRRARSQQLLWWRFAMARWIKKAWHDPVWSKVFA
jgi:hypothetical protein